MRLICLPLLAFSLSAAAQTPPRKQIVEDLRLDGVNEDFPGVFRLSVGPRGQIAVFVQQDQSLRLYDATGKKVASFGRKGGGPGESRRVVTLSFKGDTVWHYDNSLKRLTFVTPAGKLLRHEVLPPNLNLGASLDSSSNALGAMYLFSPVMIAPNGQLVAYADLVVGRDEKGKVKTEQSFLLADVDGSHRKRIGSYVKSPSPMQVKIPIDEEHFATGTIPFLTYMGTEYSADGTRFGSVTQTFTDRGGTYNVLVVRTTGDTLFSRAFPFVGTPIPAAIRDSAIEAVTRRTLSDGRLLYEPKVGAQLRDAVRPHTPRVYAPVRGIHIGRDNTTWLEMRSVGDTTEWIALNAKGDPIMSVRIPSSADLWEASLTALWVVQKDADDIPSVVRYRIK